MDKRLEPLRGRELEEFLERIRPGLNEEDFQRIQFMSRAWPELTDLAQAGTSAKLQRILFGPKTEKTSTIFPPPAGSNRKERKKRKGHGRNGAGAYTGARQVFVPHPALKAGQECEKCHQGNVRDRKRNAQEVRVKGSAPVTATRYHLQTLRCDTCGEVFTAPLPPEAGTQKYDPSVGVTVAMLRHGSGMPHHRLARLQAGVGVPLPESTQWEQMAPLAENAEPVLEELIRHAAQASLFHHDDTTMRVAELRKPGTAVPPGMNPSRKGVFTTSILGAGTQRPVSLFFTGRKHAGENLADVLKQRAAELGAPIQMCDALSRNTSLELPTDVAFCLAHGRREFVDLSGAFPEQSQHVLEQLQEVYRVDAQAREEGLTPEQRLELHQTHSQPVMEKLHQWLKEQIEEKKAEPNSGLGKAIGYMLRHWEPLTLFLRRAGAPLDNNACERTLKMAILHRKNSLSYKTLKGAHVGDLFMSLIQTCWINRINPFEYLVAIATHSEAVKLAPGDWLPWNYPKPGTAAAPALTPDTS
jgi:transposase